MKKIRNFVIGGIENKIFNLIIFTVLLLSASNLIVYMYHSSMLADLVQESGSEQQEAIEEITSSTMDQVIEKTLERSNNDDTEMADSMFESAANRVNYLADYASRLFAHPGDYTPKEYAGPDPGKDGTWTAKVIYADGTDPDDPEVRSRLGLLANMSDMMISLCRTSGSANVYIAAPEGVHLSVSDTSGSWYENGTLKSYDPRIRAWYKKAVKEKKLVFTDGEWDANTGAYCLECAAPVYDPSGKLAAVIGTDLYLDHMQEVMEDTEEGEYHLLINEQGKAVLAPQEDAFPLSGSDRGGDLRQSRSEDLARIIQEAMDQGSTKVCQGLLDERSYYIVGTSIPTTGWVLVSAFDKDTADKPSALLMEQNRKIQAKAQKSYQEKTRHSKATAILTDPDASASQFDPDLDYGLLPPPSLSCSQYPPPRRNYNGYGHNDWGCPVPG